MQQTKSRIIGGAAVLAVGGALATATFATAASTTSTATSQAKLTGKAEKPGPGDADGKGSATIRVKGTKVCFTLNYTKISAPQAAHIHRGSASESGPVVIGLFAGKAKKTGCVTTTSALAKELAKTPSRFYVNLHTADFPNGALRGQLKKG
jgi:hypothetical protein